MKMGSNETRRARWLGLIAFPIVAGAATAALASGPFVGMDGRWTGSGTLTLASGTKEPIRCRSQNLVKDDDNNLQQALRCASDSYKFEVNTFVSHSGGSISGNWNELSQNVIGNLKGDLNNGRIDATVTGTGFAAGFAMDISQNRQRVVITPNGEGYEITQVEIDLRKR